MREGGRTLLIFRRGCAPNFYYIHKVTAWVPFLNIKPNKLIKLFILFIFLYRRIGYITPKAPDTST